jgi:cytochrome P450
LWREPSSGVWFVLDYDLADEVMRDHHRFSSQVDRIAMRAGGLPEAAQRIRAQGWPLALTLSHNDGDSHGEYRKIVAPFFMPRGLRAIEPFVARRITELLDAIDGAGGECDFFPAFAVPLPVSVIGEALGMRELGDDIVKRWSDAFADEIGFLTSDERAVEIAQLTLDCHRAMVALCDASRAPEGEGDSEGLEGNIITRLANARLPDGRQLQNGELLSLLTQLMVAGNETTTATLGFAMLRLGQEPSLFTRLKQDRTLVSLFIEEVLRLDSPIQGQFRKAVGVQQLGGVEIEDGALVHVRFAAANRDPRVWGDDEGEPRLDRKPARPHMSFGTGIHFCIGAALSRLELARSISAILDRYSAIELTKAPEALPFRTHFHQRGMTSLPLVLRR